MTEIINQVLALLKALGIKAEVGKIYGEGYEQYAIILKPNVKGLDDPVPDVV